MSPRTLPFLRVALVLLLTFGCAAATRAEGETTVGPTPRYAAKILERSLAELRRKGEDPDEFNIDVMDHLPPGTLQYLKLRGVTDTSGVWAVSLLPKPLRPSDVPAGDIDVIRAGGDYTFFFRHPSTREFEVWLGE